MLKLKHLFNNKDLAYMILCNWEYDYIDPESPKFLEYYRISANAVYWCKNKGETFFLRFAPADEKFKEDILGELEYIKYLKSNGYSAIETILSKHGNELEVVETPWGLYYAVAFKRACGYQLSSISITDNIIFGFGKALGKLHKLSSKYTPLSHTRKSWKDIFDWMETVLLDFPNELAAKDELALLNNYFTKLPATSENFGIIHYDFEFDNVFYEKNTDTYTAIDFDDGMYFWYVADIEQSIDSIRDEVPDQHIEEYIKEFIDGYRSEFNVSDDMLKILPIFRRYANLYGYVRVLRAIDEKWNNEPEWLVNLRCKLNNHLVKGSSLFGKEI